MADGWTIHLQRAGAQFDAHTVIHFGQPQEELQHVLQGDIIVDLSHFGLAKAKGGDTQKFLQGQFTNDIRQITEQRSQLSAWCSPKGRIISNFRLFKREDFYFMLLPRENIVSMLNRLQIFILRSDVVLKEASHLLCRVGISGPGSTLLLSNFLNQSPPEAVDDCITVNNITVLRVNNSGIHPRYIVIGTEELIKNLWEQSLVQCRPVGSMAWGLLDVLAGIPHIVPETSDEFVPQMINFQAINGVSFKKGCYTGQEIVARMQYLGSLKRRMYLVKINANASPQPGDMLYTSENNQSVGKIINAYPHPEGGMAALAVIQIDCVDKDLIYLHNPQTDPIHLMELPYSLGELGTETN